MDEEYTRSIIQVRNPSKREACGKFCEIVPLIYCGCVISIYI